MATKYDYEELEEMMRRWIKANEDAAAAKDWSAFGDYYTDDAIYSWNQGPTSEFVARGREEIRTNAFGHEMKGLEDWLYPYVKTIIDPVKGEVIGMWRQLAPVQGPNGKQYEIIGTGGSWFRYAGDYKWSWQRDWFDLGNMFDCFSRMDQNGDLNDVMKKRISGQSKLYGSEKITDFNWLDTIQEREDI